MSQEKITIDKMVSAIQQWNGHYKEHPLELGEMVESFRAAEEILKRIKRFRSEFDGLYYSVYEREDATQRFLADIP